MARYVASAQLARGGVPNTFTHRTTPSWHCSAFSTLGQVLLAGCAAGVYLLSGPEGTGLGGPLKKAFDSGSERRGWGQGLGSSGPEKERLKLQ